MDENTKSARTSVHLRSGMAALLAFALLLCWACGDDDDGGGGEQGSAGDGQQAGSGAGSGGEADAGSGGQSGDGAEPEVTAHPDCDLTGKWISAQRTLTIAVGIEGVMQSAHNWGYWEFEQDGVEAVAVKGLRCGFQLKSRATTFATEITVSRAIWDAETERLPFDGRQATYGATDSDECYLHIEKRYLVRGATLDHFIDPAVDLAEATEPANGTAPGWEDWDDDGHPGVTFKVSGLASGELYVVQRDWHEYLGTTPREADKFQVGMKWNTQQITLGKSPETLPSADSVPSVDPAENFIWFARLDGSDQWDVAEDADDLAICARVREIKDQLLPEGNQ